VLRESALEPTSRDAQVARQRAYVQNAPRTTNAMNGLLRQRIGDGPISLSTQERLCEPLKGIVWISAAHLILERRRSRTPNVGQRSDPIGELARGNGQERVDAAGAQTSPDDVHVTRELDPRGTEHGPNEPRPSLR
jgi:hypothetical protein